MAAPMVMVTFSMSLLQVVAVMMVGHLSEFSLSSVSIASSFTNVAGFSVLVGMAGGLETLCGQAYGAKQYQKLGIYTCSSMISLTLVCLPISLLLIFVDKLLVMVGQDPSITLKARKYSVRLIPALFGYAILQSMVRYFQSQGLIFPMLVSSCVSLVFHVPVCWGLVFKLGLGSSGAALAIGLSYWLNVILLGFHMKYSSDCKSWCRILFSKDVLLSIKEFFCFGVPSALMVCLEWWSFELLILLSGLLPKPELETSVLSICLTTTSMHFYIPYGISAAGSTRVSNELGAGKPQTARVALLVVTVFAVAEAVIASVILFSCRSVWGYAFSNETEVAYYIKRMVPLLCLSLITDSSQAVLSGVARGCGRQNLGAYANLVAYYIIGIPMASVLCFILQLKAFGLWIGILAGSTVQVILLALLATFTDWEKQATKARDRMFQESLSRENVFG